MDPNHVMLLAREVLFSFGEECVPSALVTLLQSATERHNVEALWLVNVVAKMPTTWEEKKAEDGQRLNLAVAQSRHRWRWLAEELKGDNNDNSFLARYYRGQAMCKFHLHQGVNLLRSAAEEGHVPSMSAVALAIGGNGILFKLWAQKAANCGDPDGFALWARCVEDAPVKLALYEQSAALGSFRGMIALARPPRTSVRRTVLWARQGVLSGSRFEDAVEVLACVTRMQQGQTLYPGEVELLYVAGRELEGFETFWHEKSKLVLERMACIDFYLTVTHRARRAALQTIVGLRELRVLRDVCVLIAMRVYQTRESDAISWFYAKR